MFLRIMHIDNLILFNKLWLISLSFILSFFEKYIILCKFLCFIEDKLPLGHGMGWQSNCLGMSYCYLLHFRYTFVRQNMLVCCVPSENPCHAMCLHNSWWMDVHYILGRLMVLRGRIFVHFVFNIYYWDGNKNVIWDSIAHTIVSPYQ